MGRPPEALLAAPEGLVHQPASRRDGALDTREQRAVEEAEYRDQRVALDRQVDLAALEVPDGSGDAYPVALGECGGAGQDVGIIIHRLDVEAVHGEEDRFAPGPGREI